MAGIPGTHVRKKKSFLLVFLPATETILLLWWDIVEPHSFTLQILAREMGQRGYERRKTTIFYKMIEESINNDGKLMIPEQFVSKYGNELCATAILRVVDGTVWQIGLRKLHNKLWFCHGWSEFVYHHSIHVGSFLVFAYHRDSTFDVYICDLRSSEISKPPNLSCPKVPQHGNQSLIAPTEMKDEDAVEILSSSSGLSPAAGGRISDLHLLDKLQFDISMTGGNEDPLEDRVLKSSSSMSLQRGNVGVRVEGNIKGLKRSRTQVSYSQGFNSSKMRAVKSPVIKNLAIFYSPQQAASVHGNKEKLSQTKFTSISGSAILQSVQGDGKNYGSGEATESNSSMVELKRSVGSIRLCGKIQDTEITENGQQAVKPSHEQHTKEEDIHDNGRTSRLVSRRWRIATNREKESALLAAKMYIPSFAYYRIVLQPSYISKGTLRLSNKFARTFLNGASEFIFLEISSGKRWRTRCILRDGYAKLSSGWSVFVRENQLMEGDVCVFEVINMKDVVLKVSIFRALEDVEQHGMSC